jgi:hypothetical protein
MNETNRTAIILAAALWIVAMAVVIFITWSAHAGAVDRLGDMVEYMDSHRDEAGSRLIITLGALVLIVLALLLIVIELAPDEEEREIRVEQAGATTIIPAEPLRQRLEQALTAMDDVSGATARVFSRERGVGMKLDLTVTPDANIALVTQEASRVVVETLQADLGLPVAGPPAVRIAFGPPKARPVASSMTQPPSPPPSPQPAAPTFPSPQPPIQPIAEPPAERPIEPPPSAPGPGPSAGTQAPWPWWRPKPEGEEPPAPEGAPPDEPQS